MFLDVKILNFKISWILLALDAYSQNIMRFSLRLYIVSVDDNGKMDLSNLE